MFWEQIIWFKLGITEICDIRKNIIKFEDVQKKIC